MVAPEPALFNGTTGPCRQRRRRPTPSSHRWACRLEQGVARVSRRRIVRTLARKSAPTPRRRFLAEGGFRRRRAASRQPADLQ